MKRYNTFNSIHKALRALLYDTSLCLQQTDFTKSDEVEVASEKVRVVMEEFDDHAHHEDNFILPAIATHDPYVSHVFLDEHVQDIKLSKELGSLLEHFHLRHSDVARQEAGEAICRKFVEFMVFNLNHMAKEEKVLNELLWKHYSDNEIIAIQQKLVSTIPPEKMEFGSTWMLKGMNDDEIKTWLKSVKDSAPSFVFNRLMEIAEEVLPAKRFSHIMEHMTEGAMLA